MKGECYYVAWMMVQAGGYVICLWGNIFMRQIWDFFFANDKVFVDLRNEKYEEFRIEKCG